MTKDKIKTIIKTEDTLKTALTLHKVAEKNYQYDIDEIYNKIASYIDLINEYIQECDEKMMKYEDYIFNFADPFGSYENTKHIMKVYEQLNNCISEENNCLKCEYNDVEGDCRRAFMKDVAEIFKMFIEIK